MKRAAWERVGALSVMSMAACGGQANSPRELEQETPAEATANEPNDMAPAPADDTADPIDDAAGPSDGVNEPPAAPQPPGEDTTEVTQPGDAAKAQTLGFLFMLLESDLSSLSQTDRPFARYIHLITSESDDEVEQQRLALSEALNGSSLNEEIEHPTAVNANQRVYRIDLRDYAWEREIEFDGESMNVWEAVAQGSGYRFPELRGQRATELAQTTTPILPAPAIIDATRAYRASGGTPLGVFRRVYDEILYDPSLDEYELREAFEVIDPPPESGDFYRWGGTSFHSADGVNRSIRPNGSPFWTTNASEGGESMFDDPLDDEWAVGPALFQLPNGLVAFFGAPSYRGDSSATEAGDCIRCHYAGPLASEDALPGFIRDNEFNYSADDVEEILTLWPTSEAQAAIVEQDSALFLEARQRADLSEASARAVGQVSARHQADLDAPSLQSYLYTDSPGLDFLGLGGAVTMSREEFLRSRTVFLCRLYGNAPVGPVDCE